MSDFSQIMERSGRRGVLSPGGDTPFGDMEKIGFWGYATATGVWTANRAVYQPILVNRPVTVTGILTEVVTQNGNLDAGIYTWNDVKVVSNGGVAVAAAGLQLIDVADTALTPGWYKLAFSCSSATAVFRNSARAIGSMRVCGMQQQATAYPLPDPLTPVAYATALAPSVAAVYRASA